MAKHRRTISEAASEPDDPRPRSLTEQVYEALREDILRARRRPGQVVAEPELALHYGVSKTPVREALRLLAQDGCVIVLPRKGYLVRPLVLEAENGAADFSEQGGAIDLFLQVLRVELFDPTVRPDGDDPTTF